MRNGRLSERTKSALPTAEIGSGSWPTPTSRDHKDGSYCPNVPVNGLLGRAVWPIPTSSVGSGSRNTPGSKAHFGISLDDAIRGDGGTGRSHGPTAGRSTRRMWSTPQSSDGEKGSPSQRVPPFHRVAATDLRQALPAACVVLLAVVRKKSLLADQAGLHPMRSAKSDVLRIVARSAQDYYIQRVVVVRMVAVQVLCGWAPLASDRLDGLLRSPVESASAQHQSRSIPSESSSTTRPSTGEAGPWSAPQHGQPLSPCRRPRWPVCSSWRSPAHSAIPSASAKPLDSPAASRPLRSSRRQGRREDPGSSPATPLLGQRRRPASRPMDRPAHREYNLGRWGMSE